MSVPMPAAAARLLPTFDESRLVDELRALRETTWGQQRPYDADVLPSAGIDWRCLSLRSLGETARVPIREAREPNPSPTLLGWRGFRTPARSSRLSPAVCAPPG